MIPPSTGSQRFGHGNIPRVSSEDAPIRLGTGRLGRCRPLTRLKLDSAAKSKKKAKGGNNMKCKLMNCPTGLLALTLFVLFFSTRSTTIRAESVGRTATPIQHLVVIFQENVSFDHYFATYPFAANTSGQMFDAKGHAKNNNLASTDGAGGVGTLLTNNPNQDASGNRVNPRRFDPANI